MNISIWINGNDKLAGEIERMIAGLEKRMAELEDIKASFHKKKVGGREYWYRSGGKSGVWKYAGTAKRNPLREVEREVEKIRKREGMTRDRVRRAVIKPLGRHLLIDLDKFKPSDGEVISSLELYEALRELSR